MAAAALVWPMVALAALAGGSAIRLGVLRTLAVKRREVGIDFCRGFRGDDEPDRLRFATRNYANLFEMPVLFYVGSILLMVLGAVSPAAVGLAWAYVVLRFLHTAVHLTANPVQVRLAFFVLSNLPLIGLWVLVGMAAAA